MGGWGEGIRMDDNRGFRDVRLRSHGRRAWCYITLRATALKNDAIG
jgi:hypothetical protein